MTWVKIDDHLPTHPKVIGLSDKAFRLYVSSICFSSANQTDGEILPAALPALGGTPKLAAELVAVALWDTSRKGWAVHDYLKWNRSKSRMDEIRGERSKAGSKSAAKRYGDVQQNPNNLFLSSSNSVDPDLPNPKVSGNLEEQEEQTGNNLLDEQYRQIDRTWIQATGTTLSRVAGERFEAYVEKCSLEWVLDAIKLTGLGNKKDPRYAYAILDNWLLDGREVESPPLDDFEARKRKFQTPLVQQLAGRREQ